jgi:hypothetical protein
MGLRPTHGDESRMPFTQFDVSPDGRHLAFNTQAVLRANIGMLENIR